MNHSSQRRVGPVLGALLLVVSTLLAAMVPAVAETLEVVGLQTGAFGNLHEVGLEEQDAGSLDETGRTAGVQAYGTWGSSGDWSQGSAVSLSGSLARRQLRASPGRTFPALASAWTTVECSNEGYLDAYSMNPNDFNSRPFSTADGGAFARASLDFIAAITAPGAPPEALTQPIPLEVRMVWAVQSVGLAQAVVQAQFVDFGEPHGFVFNARHDTQGLHLAHLGVSEEAAELFELSGGPLDSTQFGPNKALPFEFLAYPNQVYRVILYAEAGAFANANVGNGWSDFAAAEAYIDPIIEIRSDYPYLEYASLEFSEDLSVDVDELTNPFVGTRLEALGHALIPEPDRGLLAMAALGTLGLLASTRRAEAERRR